MSLRRSSRRLTITGASVFSASTPMTFPTVKENDSGSSPQWMSAEEAFNNFKTPKFTKLTRRTTITRQNIFHEEDNQETAKGKLPNSLFVTVAVSPPGMQTRSRRSSIYVGKQETTVEGKNTVAKSEMKAGDLKSTKRKKVESRNMDAMKKPKKAPPRARVTQPLYPREQNKTMVDDSLMHMQNSLMTTFSDIENLSPVVLLNESRQVQLSGTGYFEEEKIKAQDNTIKIDLQRTSVKSEILRSQVTSKHTTTLVEEGYHDDINDESSKAFTPKLLTRRSFSRAEAKKRLSSVKDVNEIDRVVKKMFSPPEADSKFHQRLTSPNSRKAVSSPARVTLLKESVHSRRKSITPSSVKKPSTLNVSNRTPSRAAPKARKILGVSTPSIANSSNRGKQIERNDHDSDEECQICEEPPVSLTSEEDDISCGPHDENNMTLSHTSHSQWCTIL